jgi:uncharacterized membrane protein
MNKIIKLRKTLKDAYNRGSITKKEYKKELKWIKKNASK